MRAMLTIAAILSSTPIAAQQVRAVDPMKTPCAPANAMAGYVPTPEARARRLGDMPTAVEIRAVYRVVDGCPKPVVMRRGVGNPGTAPAPDGRPEARTLR